MKLGIVFDLLRPGIAEHSVRLLRRCHLYPSSACRILLDPIPKHTPQLDTLQFSEQFSGDVSTWTRSQ